MDKITQTRGRPKGTTKATKGLDDSIQITMRIDKGDLASVDKAARTLRISRSGLMRLAVFKLINEEKLN
jgi:hypothetical protein